MTFESLIQNFITRKKYNPANENELLDFLRHIYILEEISILDYSNLYRELEARGASNVYEEVITG